MTTNTRGEPAQMSEEARLKEENHLMVAMMDAIANLAKTPNSGLTLAAKKFRMKRIAKDLIDAADMQPEEKP